MAYASVSSAFLMKLFSKHLDKRSEKTLIDMPVLYEFADKRPLPGKSGSTMFVPRHIARNGITALTEFSIVTPSGTSAHYYSGTVAGYGDAKKYSDFLVSIAEVPTMISDDINAMTQYAANKVDSLIITQLCGAGTWVSPDGATANTDVIETTALKQRFLFDARATLGSKNAPKYSDGYYWAAITPEGNHDLFVNTSAGNELGSHLYRTDVGASKLQRATIGVLGGVRVLETTNFTKLANGAGGISEGANSGYQGFVMGPGAVAAVDLTTARLKSFIKNFGQAGIYDPIDQVMTAGIKFYFCSIAMDTSNRLVRTAYGSTI